MRKCHYDQLVETFYEILKDKTHRKLDSDRKRFESNNVPQEHRGRSPVYVGYEQSVHRVETTSASFVLCLSAVVFIGRVIVAVKGVAGQMWFVVCEVIAVWYGPYYLVGLYSACVRRNCKRTIGATIPFRSLFFGSKYLVLHRYSESVRLFRIIVFFSERRADQRVDDRMQHVQRMMHVKGEWYLKTRCCRKAIGKKSSISSEKAFSKAETLRHTITLSLPLDLVTPFDNILHDAIVDLTLDSG